MFKKIVQDKVKNISKDDIKKGATEVTGAVLENGVEVVKTGIFGILNGIIIKIILFVTFIIIVLSAGCVGTNVAIDKFTTNNEVNERVKRVE